MGQGHSSGQPGADGSGGHVDYYEVLGISLYATSDDIKKAYRKKALELHPDRNFGNTADATQLFAQVQSAYEILSNAQERAWYDAHRDEILRGIDPSGDGAGAAAAAAAAAHDEFNRRMTTAEDITRLYLSFDSGSLKFDDSASGFFSVLGDFFAQLATEERLTAERDGLAFSEYPPFGSSRDAPDEVVRPFYAAWAGFGTRKTFSWKDKYRLSDAPDRRTRRYMEKENKKAREGGVREFNGAVRALVSFVKRRDPRNAGAEAMLGEKARNEALRQKAAMQAAKDRAQHRKEAGEQEYVAPSWVKDQAVDQEFAEEQSDEWEEEGKKETTIYECVVCNKTFKSESQYEAHEKSKKHRQAVRAVEKEMRRENRKLGLDVDSSQAPSVQTSVPPSDEEDDDEKKSEPDMIQIEEIGTVDGTTASDDVSHQTSPALSSRPTDYDNDDDDESDKDSVHDPAPEPRNGLEPTNDNDTDTDQLAKDLNGQHLDTGANAITDADAKTEVDADEDKLPKIGKAKQKRAKKEARAMTTSKQSTSEHQCMVCQTDFASKNQLFKHINSTGHVGRQSVQMKAAKSGKR